MIAPQDPEQLRWFMEHIQPHEGLLRGWLRSQVSPECEIDDVVQEAFLRVLEAREKTAIASPKAFLFAVARNLALRRMRRQKVAGEVSLSDMEPGGLPDEDCDIPFALERAQELEILTKAIQTLPERCRQVITLRKLYGMSQREVAAELGIAEHTVEAQGVIGMRKLVKVFERWQATGRV